MSLSSYGCSDVLLTNVKIVNPSTDGSLRVGEGETILVIDGLISEIRQKGSRRVQRDRDVTVIDVEGRCVTPGLIDCHTHLIYAGNRASEFADRVGGKSYQQILENGGGILSTVNDTRRASTERLFELANARLRRMTRYGLTTVEVKSGYGLDLETEVKMLKVARLLDGTGARVISTFLGAHILPREFHDGKVRYINYLAKEVLPKLIDMNLVDMVDGFCDGAAFSAKELLPYFEAAKSMNLPIRVHLDQLGDTDSFAMFSDLAPISVDHLEYLNDRSIESMARGSTVAVVVPTASYFLRQQQKPPIEKLRYYGIPIALATDHNPGTSPVESLLLAMNMGCVLFNLTPGEALSGVTINAARALGISDRGSIARGMLGDLAIWDVADPVELSYYMGHSPLWARVVGGAVFRYDCTTR